MNETNFFQRIEEYCLSTLRNYNCLDSEIDKYINEFRLIYERNVDKEKVRLLSLVCESLLNYKDKEKLNDIIKNSYLSDNLKNFLLKRIAKLFDKMFSKQSEDINILASKIACNIFEFLLNEFEIDTTENNLFQFELREVKEPVKVLLFKYLIELMKVFVRQKRKDTRRKRSSNNNNNNEKHALLVNDFIDRLVNYLDEQNIVVNGIKLKEETSRYIFSP